MTSPEREHGGLCTGGVCFEDDFTEECDCWCHHSAPIFYCVPARPPWWQRTRPGAAYTGTTHTPEEV